MASIFGSIKKVLPPSLKQRLARIIIDIGGDHRNTVFIGGTGRSGTTWLASILNYDESYRDMYEPFHSLWVPQARKFRYALYLRPTNRNPDYLRVATAILTGRVSNVHIDEGNNKIVYRRRIAKEVRANLWLKWLHTSFPGMPIAWILRHPCAVASSRLLLDWPARLSMFIGHQELMADHLEPFRERANEMKTQFERHIFVWCMQHYVPLRQLQPNDVHMVFYENLCVKPEAEIRSLFSFVGRHADDDVLKHLSTPSPTTRGHSAIASGGKNLTDAWRKHISPDQIRRAVEILHLFKLDRIYGEDSMPDTAAAHGAVGKLEAF